MRGKSSARGLDSEPRTSTSGPGFDFGERCVEAPTTRCVCGKECPDTAKFCAACGAMLALQRSRPEDVEEVTFYNRRFDRACYAHPERRSQVHPFADGRMRIVQVPGAHMQFEPLKGRHYGGYFTTRDPGQIAYLRALIRGDRLNGVNYGGDRNLIELAPGVTPKPFRDPAREYVTPEMVAMGI